MKRNDDIGDLLEVTVNFEQIEALFKDFKRGDNPHDMLKAKSLQALAGNLLLNLLDELLDARDRGVREGVDPGALLGVDLAVGSLAFDVLAGRTTHEHHSRSSAEGRRPPRAGPAQGGDPGPVAHRTTPS
jgi:hypothetical protein